MTEAWFHAHRPRLDAACAAYRSREAFQPFIESPSRRHHPEGAPAAGLAAFQARLGHPFPALAPGQARVGAERSPFTGQPLGVTYVRPSADGLFAAIHAAWPALKATSREARVGLCLEILHRWAQQTFELAHATLHTAGQAFMLAFAGSGASSLERGLEGVAAAWLAMDALPRQATYTRRFGRGAPVTLEKRYRLMPVGAAVVFACGSYPAWNAYPAILANLATGNPVVVKPHPDTILPMAIAVQTGRQVLAEAGLPEDLLTLAPDTWADPIGKALVEHPAAAIVDFTGGQRFGQWLEQHLPGKQVYTETAGCNAVLLESTLDLDATLAAIAHGLCLFSAQMCTAPQNIWLPAQGVHTPGGLVPPAQVEARLAAAVDALVADPKTAGAVCGALHSGKTLDELAAVAAQAPRIVRASAPYPHPDHPQARTATPLIVGLDAADRALAQQERFGPVGFVITAPDADAALAGATQDAQRFGAIASYAYAVDPARQAAIAEAFAQAGASVGLNLHRQRPMNFTAGFSDYHVTGLNPAGTACLTDPAFVSRRFRIVQTKTELPLEAPDAQGP